ncbi:MAG TPA: hypothetical protein VMS65_09100 [Polyangiaceae bacterium]|nr:hypothetical protein [Polyangiaceae bacterium]
MPLATRRVGALALALFASACPSASSEKAEADAVSRAVTSLREADNEKKAELLAALRRTACATEDICAVRSACLAAYELHVETLARVGVVLAVDAGDTSALDAVKRDLGRAHELASKCTDAQGELMRRYKL